MPPGSGGGCLRNQLGTQLKTATTRVCRSPVRQGDDASQGRVSRTLKAASSLLEILGLSIGDKRSNHRSQPTKLSQIRRLSNQVMSLDPSLGNHILIPQQGKQPQRGPIPRLRRPQNIPLPPHLEIHSRQLESIQS